MKGYPAEVKQWWDNYGPSNWGAVSEQTAAALAIDELQEIGRDDVVPDFYTWPGGLGAITKKLAEILQPKFADRMQFRRHHRCRRPGQERSASHLHARCRTEDRGREGGHHGDSEVHHPAHCARPA